MLLISGAEIRGWPARKAKILAELEGHAVVAQILGTRIEQLGDEQGAGVSSDGEFTDEDSEGWWEVDSGRGGEGVSDSEFWKSDEE